jgi:hypothetical protein
MKHRDLAGLNPEGNREKGFDRSVTARLIGTLTFVFSKSSMPGGVVAEGHRQRAARIG